MGKSRILFLLSLSQFDLIIIRILCFYFSLEERTWRSPSIPDPRRNLFLLRGKQGWRRCRVEISDGKLKLGPRIARYRSLKLTQDDGVDSPRFSPGTSCNSSQEVSRPRPLGIRRVEAKVGMPNYL